MQFARPVLRLVLLLSMFFPMVLPSSAQSGPEAEASLELNRFFDREYDSSYEELMTRRLAGQIDRYFDRYTVDIARSRSRYWSPSFESAEAYQASIEGNREHLRKLIGVVDAREKVWMERFAIDDDSTVVAENDRCTIHQVRWPVLEGIWGEGLLLQPKEEVRACVVVLPDADQDPEDLIGLDGNHGGWAGLARRLAEQGVQVIVPVLIDREVTFSGAWVVPRLHWIDPQPRVPLYTNQTHREVLYRQAYVMGRHLIGYEVQKALAALDWMRQSHPEAPLGVAGYGEGGLVALYSGAVDRRIKGVLVSGYFGPREELWSEPVYRNVWSLLERFGDAEIGSLIVPGTLIVEYSRVPEVEEAKSREPAPGDPQQWAVRTASRSGSRGRLQTPPFEEVEKEFDRFRQLLAPAQFPVEAVFVHDRGHTTGPASEPAAHRFAASLGITHLKALESEISDQRRQNDRMARMKRQMDQISSHLMRWVHEADFDRYHFLKGDKSSPEAWDRSMDAYRRELYDELIGRLPESGGLPEPAARIRPVYDQENWTGYEVVLDVLPGVYAWGLLAVPKNIRPGEKRPVVVTQHGHAGIPSTPVRIDSYHSLLPALCERGFIVFSPHLSYQFNVRKATPLKASVYSIIVPQYQQIVRWLKGLEYVDADRIGFYGKSWGGRTALRVPALIQDFRFSICSAYFNQWPRKAINREYASSYMYTGSIGVLEFGQGIRFGHAELALLIAPRPFLVENGYRDGVKPDEWAGYEFAKVKRVYEMLGVGERTVFGTHTGGHEVHLDTILPFIHRHLQWPVPPTGRRTEAAVASEL